MQHPLPLDTLFSLAGAGAMSGWLALLVAPPGHALSRRFVLATALVLSSLYAALIGVFWTQGSGGLGSLDEVARLFEHRGLMLAGWVHYLAFDLLIGLWEREEAHRIGLTRWVLAPCLLLTLLLGPIGLLVFLGARLFHVRANGRSASAPPARPRSHLMTVRRSPT